MIKKSKIIITLGLLTAVMPFLGFPGMVRNTIIVIFGLIVTIAGFVYLIEERHVMKKDSKKEDQKKPETFVDNSGQFNKSDNPSVKINVGEDSNGKDIKLEVKGK